jgi:hypothetical protein
MSYNLDENTSQEYFEFELGGNKYRMVYPTTEELEAFQALKLPDGSADIAAMNKKVYEFVSSENPDAPSIEKALKGARVPVLRKFREMISTEFGLKD